MKKVIAFILHIVTSISAAPLSGLLFVTRFFHSLSPFSLAALSPFLFVCVTINEITLTDT